MDDEKVTRDIGISSLRGSEQDDREEINGDRVKLKYVCMKHILCRGTFLCLLLLQSSPYIIPLRSLFRGESSKFGTFLGYCQTFYHYFPSIGVCSPLLFLSAIAILLFLYDI